LARTDSRDRILDAAERLFARKGIRATTLREIAAAAEANTGSIYFHFKTKGELTREVFRRRLGPLDAERLAALEACESASAPDPPAPRAILEALIAPLARLTRGGDGGGLHFLGVLGRTYSEPDPEIIRMLERDHNGTLERFRAALARALPELPQEPLRLRFHFALGSVAHTLGSDVTWRMLSGRRPAAGAWQRVLDELLPFLVAGFEAPITPTAGTDGGAAPDDAQAPLARRRGAA
jgi:AcrR family transcriptional regulator